MSGAPRRLRLLYAPTNVHAWACSRAAAIDDELRRAAPEARALALPWHEWSLCDDGEHLVNAALPAFATALARAVVDAWDEGGDREEGREVLVLSDSSIDHYADGADVVRRALAAHGVLRATVDAVCGSGFAVAPAFAGRLRRPGRTRGGGVLVLVGGWNDAWHSAASERELRASVRRFCAAARRWTAAATG